LASFEGKADRALTQKKEKNNWSHHVLERKKERITQRVGLCRGGDVKGLWKKGANGIVLFVCRKKLLCVASLREERAGRGRERKEEIGEGKGGDIFLRRERGHFWRGRPRFACQSCRGGREKKGSGKGAGLRKGAPFGFFIRINSMFGEGEERGWQRFRKKKASTGVTLP